MEEWKEKEDREFRRAGTIAAAAFNSLAVVNQFLGVKRQDGFTANDFFNLPRPPQPKVNKFEEARNFFAAHNAKVMKLERRKKSA